MTRTPHRWTTRALGALIATAAVASAAPTTLKAAKMTEAERSLLIGLVPEETLIVYRTATTRASHVTVFTDSECPPCSKFHKWVPELVSHGIEVRYAGAPRKKPYREMVSIWCAEDRRETMDRAKRGERIEAATCDHPIAMHRSVAIGSGVKALPTLVTEQGRRIRGLKPIRRWIDAVKRATEQDGARPTDTAGTQSEPTGGK